MLNARAQYPTSTLADLYDPLTMPAPLLKAHQQLGRAVDRCYRPEAFPSDRHRVEHLFALYEKLTAPLVAAARPARARRKLAGTSASKEHSEHVVYGFRLAEDAKCFGWQKKLGAGRILWYG